MRNGDDRDRSGFSESAFPEESSSGPSVGLALQGLAASAQEEAYGGDRPPDADAPPPPLGVKLTVYRLLNVTILFSFGLTKSILAYEGKSTTPTTLDWVGGTLLAAVLYWIGLYGDTKKWEWFFEVDLAPAIGYCTKRFVGGVMWPLFSFNGLFVFTFSLGSLLVILAADPFNYYFSNLHRLYSFVLGFSLGSMIYGCMILLCYSIRRVRERVWAWQRAVCFVDEYGLGAPLEERYWWFGVVGTIAGSFCGITLLLCGIVLIGLPFVGLQN